MYSLTLIDEIYGYPIFDTEEMTASEVVETINDYEDRGFLFTSVIYKDNELKPIGYEDVYEQCH